MSDWVDVATALVGALTGGTALKIVESWLGKSKYKADQDKIFRDELRADALQLRKQIDELRQDLRKTELELDEWKNKYWSVFMSHKQFVIEIHSILLKHGIDPGLVLDEQYLLAKVKVIDTDA